MPPPPELNRKIAIIGSGPSGIFTCYFLNKLGYTNIHLYGDINDAQPKTIMVDDIVNDVTTSYTHNGYRNSIGKIVDEFGFYKNGMSSLPIKNNEITTWEKVDENLLILKFMASGVLWKFLKDTTVSKLLFSQSLKSFKDKYITEKTSFWLDSGGSSQGYGFLDEVSAYHLFRWLRPSIFLSRKLGEESNPYMIRQGFGTLFKAIYDSLETKRKINKKVIKVSKNQLITEDNKTKHYDDIFVCCPLSSIKTPLNINNDKHITYSKVFTYLFESKNKIKDLIHIGYCLDNITGHKKTSVLTLRINDKTTDGSVSKCGRHIYGCFGYCETFNEDEVKSIIQKELKGYGFDIKTDLYFKIYKYNYRFTEKAIEEGVHLYVNEQQGKDGLYYLGGMLSHWDVDSIYEHSREIVNHFHLNNTSNPIDKLQTLANIQYNKWIDEW
jgi:hypothetical protein